MIVTLGGGGDSFFFFFFSYFACLLFVCYYFPMATLMVHFPPNNGVTLTFFPVRGSISAALKGPEESPQGVSIGTVTFSAACVPYSRVYF